MSQQKNKVADAEVIPGLEDVTQSNGFGSLLKDLDIEKHLPKNQDNVKAPYPPSLTEKEKEELDSRSIFIGNVDYSVTAKELEEHFKGCGVINRITILSNKFTGRPKGFAYLEFDSCDAVDLSMLLDETSLKGRQIKVTTKRTNIHRYHKKNTSIAPAAGPIPAKTVAAGKKARIEERDLRHSLKQRVRRFVPY